LRRRRIKGSPNEEEVDHIQAKEAQETNNMSNDELRSSRNKIAITNSSSYLIQFAVASETGRKKRLTEQGSAQNKGRNRK